MNKVFDFKLAKQEFIKDLWSNAFAHKLKQLEDLDESNCDQVLAASQLYQADFDDLKLDFYSD